MINADLSPEDMGYDNEDERAGDVTECPICLYYENETCDHEENDIADFEQEDKGEAMYDTMMQKIELETLRGVYDL